MNDSGLYSIVTDGTFLYALNTYRNTVCRISKSGSFNSTFVAVDKPISLAVSTRTLFVQSLRFIHIYRLDVNYNTTTVISLPYESSDIFPSMVYKDNENLLYISNYTKGTITTLNSAGIFRVICSGLVGISGLTVVSNTIYFSNYIENTVSYFVQGTVQNYISIDKPKGLAYDSENLYICYGTKDAGYGIAINAYGTETYRNIFTAYISVSIPTTVITLENSFYFTLEKVNSIYKKNDLFITIPFEPVKMYNSQGITQSVISTNINCVTNPAYNGLLNLRTLGSNPINPIPPITTRVGRASGEAISFYQGIGTSYDSYKMRRKAETLKYRNSTNNPGITLTNKHLFANVVKYGGAYNFSKARLTYLLKENNGELPCDIGINDGNPIVITPPTNSGIRDPTFEGYYLNPYVAYRPSL